MRREEFRVEREPITDANIDDATEGPAISEEEQQVSETVSKEQIEVDGAERWFGFHLGRREWTGVVLASIGLAFLTLTAAGETGGTSSDYSLAAMLAWESALVGLGTLLIVMHRSSRHESRKGILLGVAAGLLFTVSHVAVKAATGNVDQGVLHAAPFILVALAAGVCAFFASARSLQIGEGVSVIAVTSIASNASSIPAGIVVFGDPLGEGAATIALRCLAFLLVVAAATLIPGPTRAGAAQGQGRAEPVAT